MIKIINSKLEILVNGVKRYFTILPDVALSNWDTDYKLGLGNELTFDRPWIGKIFKAAILTNMQAIDYVEYNSLKTPNTYSNPIKRKISLSKFNFIGNRYSQIQDTLINFFVFLCLDSYPYFSQIKNNYISG